MLKVTMPVIVEGKYDKIKLSKVIDGVILVCGGFSIFSDHELCTFIKKAALDGGIIVATDSDRSGFKIRNHIKSIAGANAKIINVYIPQIKGKERRKIAPSAQGILGLEGIDTKILTEAFIKAGACSDDIQLRNDFITTATLFELGFMGGENSSQNRQRLLTALELPSHINTKTLLKILNTRYSQEESMEILKQTVKEG
ncbi:MAG: DUF4093 domain-containing protein [Oscillospiraceae bacterium]